MRHNRTAVFLILLAVLVTIPALGTTQRTFVSHTGLDTNPCSVDMPCRSFAAAIVQTNANGEVVAIDSAGYGSVTITQAATIVAPLGVHAGISVVSGDGVTVNAGSGVVVLRNLYINAQGGVNGITLTSANTLHVEHCVVSGFSNNDINLLPTASAVVTISETVTRQAASSGIDGDSAATLVDHCRMESNAIGVLAIRASVAIAYSNADQNSSTGFYAQGTSNGSAFMAVETCVVSYSSSGMRVDNGSLVVHNTTAFKNLANYFDAGGSFSADNCIAEGGNSGFLVESVGDASISDCTIADAVDFGVFVNSGTARLTGNKITRNGTGISNAGGTTGDNMVDGNSTETSGTILAANKA